MILHPNPFERCAECIFNLQYTILASPYLFSSLLVGRPRHAGLHLLLLSSQCGGPHSGHHVHY